MNNFAGCGNAVRNAVVSLWMAVVSVVLLSGCAGTPDGQHDTVPADATPESAGQASPATPATNPPATGLSPELLHDLLLANIADRRGRPATAAQALARAAHASRDPRIVAEAIRLAGQQQDHRRVLELAGLMAEIRPGGFHNQLTLAGAQFATGQGERALAGLIELARQQPADGEAGLRLIASELAKQPASILPKFRAGIAPWPDNPQLKLTAALLAFELELPAAFREIIDQALQLRPGWETAAMWKLTHTADAGPGKMAAFADDFLQKFPDADRFRTHYGKLLLHAEQPGPALVQLDAVLERNPRASEALFSGGLAHLQLENLPLAREQLRKFLALDPGNDRARLYIADIEIELENLDSAAAVLRDVFSRPYYPDAQVKLARVLATQNGIEAGIRHLERVDARNEEEIVRVILAKGELYRDFDLPGPALAVLGDGLERIPQHPDLLYNRGLLAAQLELLELHELDMRALIRLQPDNAHAYNALGYTLADQTERLDEAFELIRKALEILPDDPFILDSMGWVHFRIGNNDLAIEYLRRALEMRKDAEIAAHLGEALWVAGNKLEAREIWRQGREWSPDNATLRETMERFSEEQPPGEVSMHHSDVLAGRTGTA